MIISEVKFKNREINLCSENYDKAENVFTIIVGRNGTGKSQLLQKLIQLTICSTLGPGFYNSPYHGHLEYHENRDFLKVDLTGCLTFSDGVSLYKTNIFKREYPIPGGLENLPKDELEEMLDHFYLDDFKENRIKLEQFIDNAPQDKIKTPKKIIAVSSSPFDKFPVFREVRNPMYSDALSSYYLYFGARTPYTSRIEYSYSKSHLRSKLDQLGTSFINFFLKSNKSKNELQPLFSYLGFKSKFIISLKLPSRFSFTHTFKDKDHVPLKVIQELRDHRYRDYRDRDYPKVSDLKNDEDNKIIMENLRSIYKKIFLNFDINGINKDNGILSIELDIDNSFKASLGILEEISILANYDLLVLNDIEFIKKEEDKMFFLTQASSGELCTLFNTVAIAGSISDNSIILLDEPELSLHPEWQRDFLPLVKRMFSNYSDCHFIIATHSPSIVSSIPESNSFVVNLENNPANSISGKDYSLKSVDYQLAETFHAPGYKNEYLIHQLISVLSQLSEGRSLDVDFMIKINKLIEFNSLVDPDDPVKKLISTLKKALEVIKHD